MASATQYDAPNDARVQDTDPDDNSPEPKLPAVKGAKPAGGGFFTVYKHGQGYWTRMGTALGGILLIIVTALFVHEQAGTRLSGAFYTPQIVQPGMPAEQIDAINKANTAASTYSAQTASYVAFGLTAATVVGLALLFWYLLNKPRNADFLISTDVEMKKVQWGTRQELIGSTRVVIFFLAMIVLLLFLIDVGTGLLFQVIGLLKFGILS